MPRCPSSANPHSPFRFTRRGPYHGTITMTAMNPTETNLLLILGEMRGDLKNIADDPTQWPFAASAEL